MNFKSLSLLPRRSRVERPERARADNGAATIVVLMMSLVFVPIVLAHAVTLYKGNIQDIGPQQLAAIVQLFVPQGSDTN